MTIDGTTIEKDIDQEMLMIDGFLEDIIEEFEAGKDVRYRIFRDGEPIAYLIPYAEYKKTKEILENSLDTVKSMI